MFKKVFKMLNKVSYRIKTILVIHLLFLGYLVVIDGLNYDAKVSLFAFLSAMVLWVGTKIPAGYVAVSLIVFIVLMKGTEPELLYSSFSEEVVWLMLGAFIIGEALNKSGLADRISQHLIKRAKNKHFIIRSFTYVLCLSALFIPSTSGRAALSMPLVKQVGIYFTAKEKEFLAILAPVIILMSTSATLIAAGSHIIGVGFLETSTGETISFVQWLIWGIPFSITITMLSTYVTKMMLWPRNASIDTISHPTCEKERNKKQPLTKSEKKTMTMIILLILSWVTEPIHGYDIALITIVGAILFMLPEYGVISWKQGIQAISWNLILFVAAATALGKVLVETGVVEWMKHEMSSVLLFFADAPEWLLVIVILVISTTSHLYITSHTTRAIVFIPTLLVFGQMIGADPVAVVFISLIGMNYCVTFPVSSKALLFFFEEDEVSYKAGNLLKVSAVLMPLYFLVMLVFYFTYWNWTGLSI